MTKIGLVPDIDDVDDVDCDDDGLGTIGDVDCDDDGLGTLGDGESDCGLSGNGFVTKIEILNGGLGPNCDAPSLVCDR